MYVSFVHAGQPECVLCDLCAEAARGCEVHHVYTYTYACLVMYVVNVCSVLVGGVYSYAVCARAHVVCRARKVCVCVA